MQSATPKTLLLSVWPLPRSLATTSGISVDFFSSPYLDVSVRAVPPVSLCIQDTVTGRYSCRIAPFGYLRLNARLQLPAAFRSLPRPSSAPSAKAFTLCSSSLDYYAIIIIGSLFWQIVVSYPISCVFSYFALSQLLLCSIFKVLPPALQASQPPALVGSSGLEPPTSRLSGVRSNRLSYEPIAFRPRPFPTVPQPLARLGGGDEENRTPDPLRAKQVLSHLSYTPTPLAGRPPPYSSGRSSRTFKIKQHRFACFSLVLTGVSSGSYSRYFSLERR